MKNLYLNKKEMYDLINGLVDQMIPGTKDGLMPPASKSVDIYHLQNYLNTNISFLKNGLETTEEELNEIYFNTKNKVFLMENVRYHNYEII